MNQTISNYKDKLLEASKDGDEQIIKLILEDQLIASRLVEEYNEDEEFIPVHIAAQYSNINCLKVLIEKFDINKKDYEGKTAIQYAIEEDKIESIQLLLNKKADLGITSHDGRTPLHRAVESENERIVKILLENNSPINLTTNRDGWTVLHYSSRMGLYDMAKILLEYNADINMRDKDDRTALHLAAQMGFVEIVNLLIEKGAPLDDINKQGRTPLHLAAQMHLPVVTALLEKGAKTSIKDMDDKTPLEIAIERDKKEIIKVINEFDTSKKESRDSLKTSKTNLPTDEEIIQDNKQVYSRKSPSTKSTGFSSVNSIDTDLDRSTPLNSGLLSSSMVKDGAKKNFLYSSWVPLSLICGVSLAFGVYHYMKNKDGDTYNNSNNSNQTSDFLIEEVNNKK